jgi:hypothetical protein
VQNIAREALIFQQTLYATNAQTHLAISEAIETTVNGNLKAELEESNINMKTIM